MFLGFEIVIVAVVVVIEVFVSAGMAANFASLEDWRSLSMSVKLADCLLGSPCEGHSLLTENAQ